MLWDCLTCTTQYAASLTACPQCGSEDRQVAGSEVGPEPATGPEAEPGQEE